MKVSPRMKRKLGKLKSARKRGCTAVFSVAAIERHAVERAARRSANLERKLEAALPGTTVYIPRDLETGIGGESVYIPKPLGQIKDTFWAERTPPPAFSCNCGTKRP